MPIEDIQYLKENSIEENFVLFIDSGTRNRKLGYTPSEYIVEFDEPFKNVFGLEILDASIPRTMYIIDKYNDKFTLTYRYNNVNYTKEILFERQDYNIETLLSELSIKLSFTIGTSSIDINAMSLSSPYIRKSIIYYESKYPFRFDFTNCPIAELLGFDEYGTNTNPNNYTYIDDRQFGCFTSISANNENFNYTYNDITTEYMNNNYNTDDSNNYKKIYKNNSAFQIFNRTLNNTEYSSYSRNINKININIGINNNFDQNNFTLSSLNIKWEIRKYDTEDKIFSPIILEGIINDESDYIIYDNNTNSNIIYNISINFKDIFESCLYEGNDGTNVFAFILHENTITDISNGHDTKIKRFQEIRLIGHVVGH